MRVALTFRQSDLLYYPFVSITWVGALARESGAKSPCKWGSDSDICRRKTNWDIMSEEDTYESWFQTKNQNE